MLIKFRFPDVFFGALLATALFAMGFVYGSLRNPSQPNKASQIANASTQHADAFTWRWFTHDAAGAFTVLLFGAAVAQIFLFYFQLRLIRKSLVPAEQAAKAALDSAATTKLSVQAIRDAERAYLWPGFAPPRQEIQGGLRFRITILNTGRTVGILQEMHLALVSEEDFEANNFSYTQVDCRGEIFPPMRRGEEIPSGVNVDVVGTTGISCGYIVYIDVHSGVTYEQGWKHRLHLTGQSEPLTRCYSDKPDKAH
jgi:hypothetical protein